MKKSNILIGIFILSFSLSFLFAPSGAKAESQKDAKKSLASILNLQTGSLMEQKPHPQSETVREARTLKQVCVSLNEELDAFVDFKSPYPQALRTRNTRDDVRAVVGFHFFLK
jgi:hypothetical protein